MRKLPILLWLVSICRADAPIHTGIDAKQYRINRIVKGIARLEGWNQAGTLVRRNHNPGALRARNGRYLRFKTDVEGWIAARHLVERYASMKLAGIARKWSESEDYGRKLAYVTGLEY